MLTPRSAVCVFTDGSAYAKDRTGGWAWVAFDEDLNEEQDSGAVEDTTISRMELQASTEALKAIWKACGSTLVLVYSDSEYVVLGCQNPSRARNVNVDMWDELDEAIELHEEVQFEHVRGHQDSYYNDLADKLAGKARRTLYDS